MEHDDETSDVDLLTGCYVLSKYGAVFLAVLEGGPSRSSIHNVVEIGEEIEDIFSPVKTKPEDSSKRVVFGICACMVVACSQRSFK